MEERQFNYTTMEGFELPSKGLIYDTPINPNVEVRAMTARDELKRTAPSNTPLKVLADVIEGCLIEKPKIHVYDMAMPDFEFLLHKVRVVSYGTDYQLVYRCPHCDEVIEQTYNLDKLAIKEIDLEKFNELRRITLPDSGHNLILNYSTPRLAERITAKAKELKKKFKDAEIDWTNYAKLTLIIYSIDDRVVNELATENLADHMTARDMYATIQAFDRLNSCIGLDTMVETECPKCGGDVTTFFRIGPEFLRPEIK